MKKLLAVAVLLCVASVASADLQWVITEVVDTDLSSRNLRGFNVSLVGTVADKDELAAVDGVLTGSLSQCWFSGATATPDIGSPWTLLPSPTAMMVDTHVLADLAGTDVIVAKKPTEDSDLPGGNLELIGSYQRGVGTKVTGPNGTENFAYAIPSGSQSLSTQLLHVVIPDGTTARLVATAVAQDGTGYAIDTPIPVPEPATLGLLAIGGIGALIRRRR